jgi:hypothetical protein
MRMRTPSAIRFLTLIRVACGPLMIPVIRGGVLAYGIRFYAAAGGACRLSLAAGTAATDRLQDTVQVAGTRLRRTHLRRQCFRPDRSQVAKRSGCRLT